jgi:hypothetical protein
LELYSLKYIESDATRTVRFPVVSNEARIEMDVSVDQARDDERAGKIHMIHMRSRREQLCGILLDRRDPTVRDRNSGQLAVRQFRPFEESVDLHEGCLATQCCNSHAPGSRGRSG